MPEVRVDCKACGRTDEPHNVSPENAIPEVPATYEVWAVKNHHDWYHQGGTVPGSMPTHELDFKATTGRLTDFNHGKDHNA